MVVFGTAIDEIVLRGNRLRMGHPPPGEFRMVTDRQKRSGWLLTGLSGCSVESCSVVAHWLKTAALSAALSSPTGSRPVKKNMKQMTEMHS